MKSNKIDEALAQVMAALDQAEVDLTVAERSILYGLMEEETDGRLFDMAGDDEDDDEDEDSFDDSDIDE